ncbi:MAG: hypothetical protein IH591_01815 [Bacteroidales bacterium]|nr:hypothetical protein [Bacteroidales bacterium]
MNRILLLTVFMFALTLNGISQDLIITLSNDTIDCRITKVTRSDIFFELTTMGIRSEGRLPLLGILNYTVSPGLNQSATNTILQPASYHKLRIGINGGGGYLYGSAESAVAQMVSWGIPQDQAESYYTHLKKGIYGSGDVTWMLRPGIGLGIRYKFFDTSGRTEGYFDPQDGEIIFFSEFQEHIYVNFAGVSFFYGQKLGAAQRLMVYCAYAAGMSYYRDEARLFYGNILITGKSFGMDGSIGFEYHIRPGVSVGTEVSSFSSILRKVKMTDGSETETLSLEKENYENLSRFELSLGLRFYLWQK